MMMKMKYPKRSSRQYRNHLCLKTRVKSRLNLSLNKHLRRVRRKDKEKERRLTTTLSQVITTAPTGWLSKRSPNSCNQTPHKFRTQLQGVELTRFSRTGKVPGTRVTWMETRLAIKKANAATQKWLYPLADITKTNSMERHPPWQTKVWLVRAQQMVKTRVRSPIRRAHPRSIQIDQIS